MASESTNPNRYAQGDMASIGNVDELREYLGRELQKLGALVNMLADGQIERSYAPPDKFKDGMIRYADGTSWDPGSGQGIYYFDGTTWQFLG